MDDLLELKEVVHQLTESKRLQRGKDAERKRKQRERDAEEETRGRLSLPKIIFMKDKRIGLKYLLWAHVGIQFGVTGEWRTFLQYVASDWNNNTYTSKPITKSNNRCHWYDQGMRHDWSWADMFGSERGVNPRTVKEIKWWEFRWHMIEVCKRMVEQPT